MNQLAKMLKTVKETTVINWDIVRKIVIDTKFKVIESSWSESYKCKNPEMYPLDLSSIDTWSTFSECVTLDFKIQGIKLLCSARVYEGDMCDGNPTTRRFTATLELPMSFVNEIKPYIINDFDIYCDIQYFDSVEKAKAEWIKKYAESILH
jgi:hypothetical protein